MDIPTELRNPFTRIILLLALVCGALCLLILSAVALLTPLLPQSNILAYSVYAGAEKDVFVADVNHRLSHNITALDGQYCCPSWSPDGAQMAFITFRDSSYEIGVMDADGANVRWLARNSVFVGLPMQWSLDGRTIGFASVQDNWSFYLLDVASGQLKRLQANIPFNLLPVMSPRDEQIALVSFREGSSQIMLTDSNARDYRPVTEKGIFTSQPMRWSPDGQQIAFVALQDSQWGIYLSDVKTGDVRALAISNIASDTVPSWSPDGQQIAFVTLENGAREMYAVTTADGALQRINTLPSNAINPIWSPDGQQIAFVATRNGEREIYVINTDGTNLRRIAHITEDSAYIAWKP